MIWLIWERVEDIVVDSLVLVIWPFLAGLEATLIFISVLFSYVSFAKLVEKCLVIEFI